MPRSKAQNEQMREATKQKIQDAASKLFSEKGVAATNVSEIAELAGISMGLLYRHNKSKEELFTTLIDDANERLMRIDNVLRSGGDPKETIEWMCSIIYDELLSEGEFLGLMMLITQGLFVKDSENFEKIIEGDIRILQSVSELIQQGQVLGEFGPGDPSQMSMVFLANVHGLAVLKTAFGKDFKLPDLSLLMAFLYMRETQVESLK
jgi:AcrR family transcriptional regulator